MSLPPLLSSVTVAAFRKSFFGPQLPCRFPSSHFSAHFPAISTWFTPDGKVNRDFFNRTLHEPHRLVGVEAVSPDKTHFERIDVPFSMFLEYLSMEEGSAALPSLYLAQVPLLDVFPELKSSLAPVPEIVMRTGKGDVYDTNLWIGKSETINTPLHKDPNPNLFVQLAGRKRVRILSPDAGRALFDDFAIKVDRFRGEDMMIGDTKERVEKAAWGDNNRNAFEVEVAAGDGIFIPQGWWHAVKGIGRGVGGSVNWWFR